MKLDTHPVTGEPREYLVMPPSRSLQRVKLRTPKAIARRMKYRTDKAKKTRIRCQFCRNQFTPKRSTKRFCNAICRNKSNTQEHKQFKALSIYAQWYQLPIEVRKASPQVESMRELIRKIA